MRSIWGTLAVCLAALVVLSTLSLQPGVRAEDSGMTAVEPVTPPQFANLEVRDIAWNANNTMCVAVGIDLLGTGNCAYYNYTNTSNGWLPLPFTIGASEKFLGVDYDSISDCYVIVGGSVTGSTPIAWLWYPGSTWFSLPAPGAASGVFTDVASIPASRFMVTTTFGNAYYYHYLSPTWFYNQTQGALPTPGIQLNNTMYDPNDGVVLMSGGSNMSNGCAYASYTSDLFADRFVAYNVGPNNPFPKFNGGDWCQQYDFGVLVGPRNITKINVTTDPFNWYEAWTYGGSTPPARYDHAMATYSVGYNRTILFGGWNGTYMGDTWEYNAFNKAWTKLNPATSPPARYGHAMAYDKLRLEIILYGGQTSGGLQQDTWAFNLTSMNWVNRANTSPLGILRDHAMCYCDSLGRVVVYGGYNAGAKNTMANWGGASWTTMTGGAAPATYEQAMAYDPFYNQIVMYGGVGCEGTTYVYIFGSGWSLRTPGTSPPPRSSHAAAYSTYFCGALIYGGYYSGYLNDIWYYNCSANSWYAVGTANIPVAVRSHAMTAGYGGAIYAFGGYNASVSYFDRTWILGPELKVSGTVLSDDPSKTWFAAAWYPYTAPADTECLIVGNDGNITRLDPNATFVQPMENPYAQLGRHLYAVGCKAPTSPGYAIALGTPGGGVKINQVSAGSQVNVGADAPHVVYLCMNNSAGSPVNNAKVNVDSGTWTNYYNIEAEIYHLWGAKNISQVDLWGWYDNGALGNDLPNALGAAFDTPGQENLRFHYSFNNTTAIWSQPYPNHAGDMESYLWNGNSFIWPVNYTTSRIRFCVVPMKQFRHAPGPATWAEPAGARYSYAINGQETTAALDDPLSWDFKLKVTLADGMNSSAYDELGVFKYTYIGASNLPGDQSGSGPPGGTASLSPAGNVSFVSNCNYSLKVYMDDLLRGAADANRTMAASALGVMGGDLQNWTFPGTQAHFNGTGSVNALYLFAWSGGYLPPKANGTLTSTGQGAIGAVRWRCIIPLGTAEDRYATTITFVLEHD